MLRMTHLLNGLLITVVTFWGRFYLNVCLMDTIFVAGNMILSFSTKTNHLTDSGFIIRMLYKNCC